MQGQASLEGVQVLWSPCVVQMQLGLQARTPLPWPCSDSGSTRPLLHGAVTLLTAGTPSHCWVMWKSMLRSLLGISPAHY